MSTLNTTALFLKLFLLFHTIQMTVVEFEFTRKTAELNEKTDPIIFENYGIFLNDNNVVIYKFKFDNFVKIWKLHTDSNTLYTSIHKVRINELVILIDGEVHGDKVNYIIVYFEKLHIIKFTSEQIYRSKLIAFKMDAIFFMTKKYLLYIRGENLIEVKLNDNVVLTRDLFETDYYYIKSKKNMYLLNLSNSKLRFINTSKTFVESNIFYDEKKSEFLLYKDEKFWKMQFDDSLRINNNSTILKKITVWSGRVVLQLEVKKKEINYWSFDTWWYTKKVENKDKKMETLYLISDKTMTKYTPLITNQNGEINNVIFFDKLKNSQNLLKDFIVIRQNCSSIITYNRGDYWNRVNVLNPYCDYELVDNRLLGYIMIKLPLYYDFRVIFSFDDLYSLTNVFHDTIIMHKNILVNNDMALVIMYGYINTVLSFDGCRSWNVLNNMKSYSTNFNFDKPFHGYYDDYNGHVVISQITDKKLISISMHLKNIQPCHHKSIISQTICNQGYTYVYSVENKNNHVCYLTKSQVFPQRNITCQCIEHDFSCANDYIISLDNPICHKPNNTNKKTMVCLNGKNVYVDILGFENVYDVEYYSSYCVANIFNKKYHNVDCSNLQLLLNEMKQNSSRDTVNEHTKTKYQSNYKYFYIAFLIVPIIIFFINFFHNKYRTRYILRVM